MRIRKLFAGSNSAQGFYSLFQHIIGPEAKRVYLIKGGPGTGKGFFMKSIAETLQNEGFDLELFYCSSDSHSLDAVSCPDLGVALIDATFPHMQDAKWPGCRDELICLGNFWSKDVLEAKRTEIIEGGLAKATYFDQAFRYFAAALALEENMASRNERNKKDCSLEVNEILAQIQGYQKGPQYGPSKARHLFSSALTPEGYVSQIQNLVQDFPRRYILSGPVGSGKSDYQKLILSHGELQGLQIEAFHYPLNPEKILHIFFPELGLAVLTASSLEPLADLEAKRVICSQVGYDESRQDQNAGDHRLFRELMDLGITTLQKAQKSHIKVEEYYAESMDFDAVNELREKISAEILGYKKRP